MTAWWEDIPERLGYEISRFEARGLRVTGDVRGQALALLTTVAGGGRWVDIEVVYPPLFPDVAPVLLMLGEALPRHHGWDGQVCLTPDPDGIDWWPGFSAADELLPRLRRLLDDTAAGHEAVAEGEIDWAEPATAFMTFDDDAVVVLPEGVWRDELPALRGGARLRRVNECLWIADDIQARGQDGRLVEADPPEVRTLLGPSQREEEHVRWFELEAAPERDDFIDGLLDGQRLLGRQAVRGIVRSGGSSDGRLILLTFFEEGPGVGEQRRTWIAGSLLNVQTDDLSYPIVPHRAQELSHASREQRLPGMAALQDRHIALVGAGSLGSPVALELAKLGVGRLTIIDPDHYDVGNAVRHELPMQAAGMNKAEALRQLAEHRNPFIEIVAVTKRLGAHAGTSAAAEDPVAVDAVAAADLVIDTTGSPNAARSVTSLRPTKADVIVAGLTEGAYGGEILIHRTDGACFLCFKLHQDDATINRAPAAERRGPVTPAGCRAPTFTGPGFEATGLATHVVRTAVRALGCTDYRDLRHNWHLLDFRGGTDDTGTADVHEDCPNHG